MVEMVEMMVEMVEMVVMMMVEMVEMVVMMVETVEMVETVCTLVLIMTRERMKECILVVDPRMIWETSILLTRQAMIILMNMIQEKKTNLFNIFHRFLSFMIVYD